VAEQGVLAEELSVIGDHHHDRLLAHQLEEFAEQRVGGGGGAVQQIAPGRDVFGGEQVSVLGRRQHPHADGLESVK
jgi:hypothetical protein